MPSVEGEGSNLKAVYGEVSSSHGIMLSDSAAGLASINLEAADVEIRGIAGAIGIPGAVGRDQTGSFRLFGLFSLSRSVDCLIGKSKKHKTK
jgi:hypothetical protein